MKKGIRLPIVISFFLSTLNAFSQVPGAAGSISGSNSLCVGFTATYSVQPIANATSYQWSPSGPVSFVGNATGSTVTINIPSNFAGTGLTLAVRGVNSSGNGSYSPAYYITIYKQGSPPSPISGLINVCPGQNGVPYSISPLANPSNYVWLLPSGASLASGSNTNSISVNFSSSFTGGEIRVFGVYGPCGSGTYSVLTVSGNVAVPNASQPITGTSLVSLGQTGVVYSVPAIANATGYSWNIPVGATITSGQNTNSITVSYSSSASSGNVSVYGTNCAGNGASSLFPVTVKLPPDPASTISGFTTVCTGTSATYSVPVIENATSYEWVPENAPVSIVAVSNNTVTISFPANYPSSNITLKVRGVNSSGTGAFSPTLVIASLPGLPSLGTITGPTIVCPGQTNVVYSVSPQVYGDTYVWSSPFFGGGSYDPSFTFNFPSNFTGGQISVRPIVGPCSGPLSTLSVGVVQPVGAAGVITGSSSICPNETGIVYSVPIIANASEYIWSIPAGATITSGQNTNVITVTYSATPLVGNVSVYGTNCTGNGAASSNAVTLKPLPEVAGVITGSALVCPGETGVTYTVPSIANASGYVWVVPSGSTIISGQNTNSITVNYLTTYISGNVSVYGTNCTGNGVASSFAVSAKPLAGTPGTIAGSTLVCPGETGVTYTVPSITNASGYVWTVPSGSTITSGQNTNSITVDFPASLSAYSGGDVSVNGTNCGFSGTTAILAVNFSGEVAAGNASHSVDLATGILSASIPLFAITDGDVQVPVSLEYVASGVRVTDDDGWVGQNWRLSVQSYRINREMRGLPDDYTSSTDSRKGWLLGSMGTTIDGFIPTVAEGTNYNFLNSIDYTQDTEPDVFYVSAPGLSFQFYFDKNKIPRALPFQDVIISPNTTSGAIASFTIKDSNGVTYTFSEMESITESVVTPNAHYLVRQSNLFKDPITYTTSWQLSSMVSPIYGTITFTYKTVNVYDENLIPDWYKVTTRYKYRFRTNFSTKELGFIGGYINYNRNSTIKVLQSISSLGMEANFESTPKYTGATMERLNSITVYDKRDGTSKLARTISLLYTLSGTAQRALLTKVNQSSACISSYHLMGYYGPQLPEYNTSSKDDWAYYSPYPYDQNALSGTLKTITHPNKGYDAFFYEPHDYWDGTSFVQGGGIRVKKTISHDGVSSGGDQIKDYLYKTASGESSGKLQYKALHDFPVAQHEKLTRSGVYYPTLRYRDAQQIPGISLSDLNKLFLVHTDEELSHYNMLHGSVVAYERVIVKEKDAGQNIYDFDLPGSFGDASANDNEWKASQVSVARPSTSYELANIQQGMGQYPFPPSPNYEFAKALLKKVTSLKEDGTVVRDVVSTYQRVYRNGASIGKIYGLALEELPTYYYDGSTYVDGKMFLYSKYELFADVKTELSTQTETVYNSIDLTNKTVTNTNFFFDSPNHGELTRVETQSSDGSWIKKKHTYVKDYVLSSPSDVASTALANMKTANRSVVVETLTTKVAGSVETYIDASLILFKTIGGKVYPDKHYTFVSNDGTQAFLPSSINGGTTFQFDQANYVLNQTYLSFDDYGNITEITGRDRDVNSVIYGYNGTLPVLSSSHVRVGEMRYSTFEPSGSPSTFYPSGSYSQCVGRNNSVGISLPAGSSNALNSSIANNKSTWFIFSFWLKAPSSGTVSLQIGTSTSVTLPIYFTASTEWKYYKLKSPLGGSMLGNPTGFWLKVWSDVAVQVDDMALYPEHADFVAYTYRIPYGKTSETDSRGISTFYDYDSWGRLKAAYDRNRNVIKKYDYQVKP